MPEPEACTEGEKCSPLRSQADFKAECASVPFQSKSGSRLRVWAVAVRPASPPTCSGRGEREGPRWGTVRVLDLGSVGNEDAEVRGGA